MYCIYLNIYVLYTAIEEGDIKAGGEGEGYEAVIEAPAHPSTRARTHTPSFSASLSFARAHSHSDVVFDTSTHFR